ncbi:autophagy protein 16-domain-containing protein [Lipomyces arxii]|uniref:autophagy protein 16-domain-containing protein n=1 Tax=Lipomyces arxii TaxID=56418 RepID=UPI0034CF443A
MATKGASWQDSMLKAIENGRDVREKAEYYRFEAYSKMLDRMIAAEHNAAQLSSSSDPDSTEIVKLQSEVKSLHDFQRAAKSRIKVLEADTQTLKDYNARIVAEFKKLNLENKKLDTRARLREDEHRARKQVLQDLQDEILTYQMQLNIAEDRVNKLERENAELINRWMERVTREAEKLNDANAFLESIDRTRVMTRESTPSTDSGIMHTSSNNEARDPKV